MQKQILFGLAAAALLTACSQDEAVDRMVDDSNLIKVGVNVAGNSRAANSYCDHILPTNFHLTSAHVGENAPNKGYYFKDVEMTVSPNGKATFSDGSDRYWPDNALYFFAWHTTQEGVTAEYTFGEGSNLTQADQTQGGALSRAEAAVASASVTIKGFSVNPDVSKQEDFIYAKAAGSKGSDVQLTFEHALSQVVFSAKCENTSIKVNVKEVGFSGLYGTADFVVATTAGSSIKDTDMADEMMTYGMTVGDVLVEGTIAEDYWVKNESSVSNQEYMIDLGEAGVDLTSEVKPLTSAPVDTLHAPAANEDGTLDWSNWSQVMQLLPQSTSVLQLLQKPARIDRAGDQAGEDNSLRIINKVYLKVCCDILAPNEAKEGQEQTYTTLFSSVNESGEKQYIYIPVGFTWNPGYRYVYTLNFSPEGNGGVINPEDPDPDPVLKNLNIKVTVNEYNDGGESVAGYETISDTMLEELWDGKR